MDVPREGDMQYFRLTKQGKDLARSLVDPVKKLTRDQKRYQRFLDLDFGITFAEFLKSPQLYRDL